MTDMDAALILVSSTETKERLEALFGQTLTIYFTFRILDIGYNNETINDENICL